MNKQLKENAKQPTGFVHIRTPNFRGTVAWRYNDEARVVEAAVSRCSKRDQFNKKIGRMVSTGRLIKGEFISVPYDALPETTFKAVAGYFHNTTGIGLSYEGQQALLTCESSGTPAAECCGATCQSP